VIDSPSLDGAGNTRCDPARTDYRTGKLSEEDYRGLDRLLRSEAVEILRAIDELEARAGRASD